MVVSLQNALVIRCQVIDKLSGNLRPQFLNAPSSYCAFRSENTSLRINVSRCQGIKMSRKCKICNCVDVNKGEQFVSGSNLDSMFKFRARGFQISGETAKWSKQLENLSETMISEQYPDICRL